MTKKELVHAVKQMKIQITELETIQADNQAIEDKLAKLEAIVAQLAAKQ